MADAEDLKSSGVLPHGGSSPPPGTIFIQSKFYERKRLLLRGFIRPDETRQIAVFADVCNGKSLTVHDDVDSWRENARGEEAFGHVLQAVAAFEA
jgi:hypothetical protein